MKIARCSRTIEYPAAAVTSFGWHFEATAWSESFEFFISPESRDKFVAVVEAAAETGEGMAATDGPLGYRGAERLAALVIASLVSLPGPPNGQWLVDAEEHGEFAPGPISRARTAAAAFLFNR